MSAIDPPFWALVQPDDHPAVVAADGETWSYAKLTERADAAARLWRRDAKSLVLLLARNDPPTLAAYLGALRVGDPVIIVDPRTPLAVLAAIVENYRPDAIVHPSDMADPMLDGYDVVATGLGLAVSAPEEFDVPAPHPDLAVVIAGGDGADVGKFVRLSRRNLASQAAAMSAGLCVSAEGRAIAALPPSDCHGLAVINAHLQAGAAVLAIEQSFASPEFWTFARSQYASLIACSAYGVELLERMHFESSRLPALRVMVLAGGGLSSDRLQRIDAVFRPLGVAVVTVLGGADSAGCMAYVPAAVSPAKLGAIGVAFPWSRISIDPVSGMLHHAGPLVALGYAETRADLSRGDDLRGALNSGECGWIDADDFIWPAALQPRPLAKQAQPTAIPTSP